MRAEGKLELLLPGDAAAERNHFTKGKLRSQRIAWRAWRRARQKPTFPGTETHPALPPSGVWTEAGCLGNPVSPIRGGCLRVPLFTHQGELCSEGGKEYVGKHSHQSKAKASSWRGQPYRRGREGFLWSFCIVSNFYFIYLFF